MSDTSGKVYVFNLCGETVETFAPNGLTAGSIANWPGVGEDPYVPADLAVDRVAEAGQAPGHFVNGRNKVIFQTTLTFHFSLEIDEERFPLDKDLLLYLCHNKWLLYSTDGAWVDIGDVVPGPAFGYTV